MKEHELLPLEEQYVRYAEVHNVAGEPKFSLVICMLRAMSRHLMQAKRVSIDTSFRQLHDWEEFEIESWESDSKRCKGEVHLFSAMDSHLGSAAVVCSRAFTTSQSAEAHFVLLKRIFEIASQDTGLPVQFKHIHGQGFETWIADAHKGQGLGT